MSTQNKIKESEKKSEYPSRLNHQETEAKPKKLFSSNKICFQHPVSKLPTLQEVLHRADETLEDEDPNALAHCMHCQRTGFVSEVSA